jgi:hypothetical protein
VHRFTLRYPVPPESPYHYILERILPTNRGEIMEIFCEEYEEGGINEIICYGVINPI